MESADDIESFELPINALFPNSDKRTYYFNEDSIVQDMIDMIVKDSTIRVPEDRNVKILYHGKVLDDNSRFRDVERDLSSFTVNVLYRREFIQEGEKDNGGEELRGFDRLVRMNYTQEEIDDIRRRFHSLHGSTEFNDESRLEAEEEWLPTIFNSDNPLEALRPAGSRRQRVRYVHIDPEEPSRWLGFFLSMFIGSIFGILSLLIIFSSYRDKYVVFGVLCGLIINLFLKYALKIAVI